MTTQANESRQDKWIRFAKVMFENWGKAKVPQNAAQVTYYTLLALFPLLLVLANVIPLFPIDIQELLYNLNEILPDDIFAIIAPILEDYLSSLSGGVLSIGLITSLWTASNLINSLRFVLNSVYDVEDTEENAMLGRILAPFIMIFLILVIGILGFAFIFGEQILNFLQRLLQVDLGIIDTFLALRWPVLILVIFVVFLFIYKLVPDHDLTLGQGVVGSVFSSVALMLLSELFTLYTQLTGSGNVGNAAIGTVLVLMLYLYFANMMILVGGLLNSVLYEFRNKKSVRQDKIEELEKKKDKRISQVFSTQKPTILLRQLKKVYPDQITSQQEKEQILQHIDPEA